ncbi:BglG family transcription antiterminator [Vallitalea sediminicola]
MWTERQLKILEILIKNTAGIIGSKIALRLRVSDRTVRNDISVINRCLKKYNCCISSSNKIGYYINSKDIPLIASLLLEYNNEQRLDDINIRYKFLIGKILFSEQQHINNIADELFVSPQTVYKDLIKLQSIIGDKVEAELFTIQNEIVYTTENEEVIRKVFVALLEEEITRKTTVYSLEISNLLDGFYNQDDFNILSNFIKNIFKEHSIVLSDDSFLMLVWVLYFSIIRNQINRKLSGFYVNKKSSKIIIEILKEVVDKFDELYINDIGFLDSFMWTLKLFNPSTEDINQQHQNIMQEFYDEVLKKYGFDITSCKEVYSNLTTHMDYMLRRLEEGYEYDNTARDLIKKKYAYAYEIAMLIVPIVYRYKKKYLIDSEVSYIALYIEFYFENIFQSIKVVLVSSNLSGMVNFTKQWIIKNFPNQIQIIDVIPVYQLEAFLKAQEVDLIISMTDIIKVDNKTVYVIDGLPKDVDRVNIYEHLNRCCHSNKTEQLIEKKFDEKYVSIYEEEVTFEKVIYDLSRKLYDDKYIDNHEKFYKDVIEREINYPTFLSEHFMVPHPLYTFSKKSIVSVAIIRKPIKYKDKQVKLIFLLASQAKVDKEIQELFQLFKQMGPNKKCFEMLVASKDAKHFLTQLANIFV